MAQIMKPPETLEHTMRLDEPVSQLLDDYCRFVDCTPDDYVVNFAFRKLLARDPEYKKWKASQPPCAPRKPGSGGTHPQRTA
jgi:hypothetical protein